MASLRDTLNCSLYNLNRISRIHKDSTGNPTTQCNIRRWRAANDEEENGFHDNKEKESSGDIQRRETTEEAGPEEGGEGAGQAPVLPVAQPSTKVEVDQFVKVN